MEYCQSQAAEIRQLLATNSVTTHPHEPVAAKSLAMDLQPSRAQLQAQQTENIKNTNTCSGDPNQEQNGDGEEGDMFDFGLRRFSTMLSDATATSAEQDVDDGGNGGTSATDVAKEPVPQAEDTFFSLRRLSSLVTGDSPRAADGGSANPFLAYREAVMGERHSDDDNDGDAGGEQEINFSQRLSSYITANYVTNKEENAEMDEHVDAGFDKDNSNILKPKPYALTWKE